MSIYDELWKSDRCHVGKKCWCRVIITKKGKDVITEGYLHKDLVFYIVRLHNKSLKDKKTIKNKKS